MSRWIDAEWLLNFFEPYPNDYQTPLGLLRACVDDAPSIDIVRCKECKHEPICSHSVQHTTHEPTTVTIGYKSVDYCSYGERRTDE